MWVRGWGVDVGVWMWSISSNYLCQRHPQSRRQLQHGDDVFDRKVAGGDGSGRLLRGSLLGETFRLLVEGDHWWGEGEGRGGCKGRGG